jgi:hypothetical protein
MQLPRTQHTMHDLSTPYTRDVSPVTVCRNLRHLYRGKMPIRLLRDSGRRMVKSPSARVPMSRVFSSLGRAIGSRKPPMVNLSLGDTGRRWMPSTRPVGLEDRRVKIPLGSGLGKMRVLVVACPWLRSYILLCVRTHNVVKYRSICGAAASPGNAIGSAIPRYSLIVRRDLNKTQESVRRQGSQPRVRPGERIGTSLDD